MVLGLAEGQVEGGGRHEVRATGNSQSPDEAPASAALRWGARKYLENGTGSWGFTGCGR